jgi:hypothetical protein
MFLDRNETRAVEDKKRLSTVQNVSLNVATLQMVTRLCVSYVSSVSATCTETASGRDMNYMVGDGKRLHNASNGVYTIDYLST